MKSKVIFILVLTVVLNMFFWPPKEQVTKVNNLVTYPKEFTIELSGEVVFPGTFTLYSDTTLRQVINYAGGLTSNANKSKLNLNEVLNKSKSFKIESITLSEEQYIPKLINLNTASFKELLTIPNMTEKRAANIIIYREQNGLFKSVNELIKVKYIGEVVFEKISIYFTI